MSGRRGFALLAVLWVVVALAGLVGLGVGAMRVGAFGFANRLTLERGRWAADACLAIAEARWVHHRMADSATIDLGRTTHCQWRSEDPTARLNVNTTPAPILLSAAQEVGVPAARVESLLAHRPYEDTARVRAVLQCDSSFLALLTIDGPGVVNVNVAPRAVLLALPGLGSEAAERLAEEARLGRAVTSLDQLVSLTPGERSALLAHYADLAALLTFSAPERVMTATGWVGDDGPPRGLHATVEELVVPLPDRLAVIRRRLW